MKKNIQTTTHKFTIEEQLNGLITITAISETTGDAYRIENHKLAKINIRTIVSALNKDNQQIKYHLNQKEDSIILSIQVQFEYLPLIIEQIALNKICQSSEHQLIQYSQMLGEIQQLEKKLDQISFQMKLFQKNQAVYGLNEIFSFTLQKGTYVLEYSGLFTSPSDYGINCYEQDYENMDGMKNGFFSFTIKNTDENNKSSEKKITLSFTSYDGYDRPTAWTDILSVKQSTRVVIKIENNSDSSIMNSMLSVTTVK